MAAADVQVLPEADHQGPLSEKSPIIVEVSSGVQTGLSSRQSTSTSPIQPASVSNFELEDHPIDVTRKLRVCVPVNSNAAI